METPEGFAKEGLLGSPDAWPGPNCIATSALTDNLEINCPAGDIARASGRSDRKLMGSFAGYHGPINKWRTVKQHAVC
jgi:hypothetical protein